MRRLRHRPWRLQGRPPAPMSSALSIGTATTPARTPASRPAASPRIAPVASNGAMSRRSDRLDAIARLTAHAAMDHSISAARRGRFHRWDRGRQSDHHRARGRAPPIVPPGATIRCIATLEKRRKFDLLAADMILDLSDEEVRALLNVLIEIIENDRYPMLPRVRLSQADQV